MPTGLRQRKLKVEFFFNTPATDSYRVSVYKGGSRVPLTTDAGGFSALPAGVTGGKYVGYFDTDGTSSWTVNVTRVTGATGPCQFTNVIVGPGIQPQGAVVGPWTSYSPTVSNFGAVSSATHEYRRVGDSIQIKGKFTPGTTVAAEASISFPSGVTTSDGNTLSGRWKRNNASATSVKSGPLYISGSTIYFSKDDYTTASSPFVTLNGSSLVASSEVFEYMTEFFKVNEWAGSGTVTLAQNDVEYAYNTSGITSAGASDTTTFGYGPAGVAIGSIASTTGTSSQTTMRVRFQTPIQVGDSLIVEVDQGSSGARWINIASTGIVAELFNSASIYGIGIRTSNTTDVDVKFGNKGYQPTNATYAGDGAAWSGISTWNWRVRKSAAGAAVGFGIVVPGTSSGLVSASGLPGNTTGNAVASGYVGELFGTQRAGTGGSSYSLRATTTFPSSLGSLLSTTLNKGVYLVSLSANGYTPSGSSSVELDLYVGGTSVVNQIRCDATTTGLSGCSRTVPVVITSDSTTVALYGVINGGLSITAPTQEMHIVRVA
jgi:hypothetical protein